MTLSYNLFNNNGQIISVYKYMNLKRKLLICNAHIDYNKTFLKEKK
jgi:hypothetical protein